MIQTELNKKGKSFRWVGEWKENEHYFNTEFAQDFCRIEGAVVVCKASHFSTQENKPKIVFDEQGNEIGIEKNAYWEIAILPNTDFIISGDNIPDGIITTNKLANSSVTTEKIHGGAVGFAELAENAKGVIIDYGASLDSVKKHLGTYRRQGGRMGLYVYDNALGIVPAINSNGNIIRAVSIVKSPERDEYVDVFILVFDGFAWSRQTYSQVGRVPGTNTVSTSKIANKAVTEQKLSEEVQNKLNSSLKPVILNNVTQKINIADVKANPLNYFYDNYAVKIPLKYYKDSPSWASNYFVMIFSQFYNQGLNDLRYNDYILYFDKNGNRVEKDEAGKNDIKFETLLGEYIKSLDNTEIDDAIN